MEVHIEKTGCDIRVVTPDGKVVTGKDAVTVDTNSPFVDVFYKCGNTTKYERKIISNDTIEYVPYKLTAKKLTAKKALVFAYVNGRHIFLHEFTKEGEEYEIPVRDLRKFDISNSFYLHVYFVYDNKLYKGNTIPIEIPSKGYVEISTGLKRVSVSASTFNVNIEKGDEAEQYIYNATDADVTVQLLGNQTFDCLIQKQTKKQVKFLGLKYWNLKLEEAIPFVLKVAGKVTAFLTGDTLQNKPLLALLPEGYTEEVYKKEVSVSDLQNLDKVVRETITEYFAVTKKPVSYFNVCLCTTKCVCWVEYPPKLWGKLDDLKWWEREVSFIDLDTGESGTGTLSSLKNRRIFVASDAFSVGIVYTRLPFDAEVTVKDENGETVTSPLVLAVPGKRYTVKGAEKVNVYYVGVSGDKVAVFKYTVDEFVLLPSITYGIDEYKVIATVLHVETQSGESYYVFRYAVKAVSVEVLNDGKTVKVVTEPAVANIGLSLCNYSLTGVECKKVEGEYVTFSDNVKTLYFTGELPVIDETGNEFVYSRLNEIENVSLVPPVVIVETPENYTDTVDLFVKYVSYGNVELRYVGRVQIPSAINISEILYRAQSVVSVILTNGVVYKEILVNKEIQPPSVEVTPDGVRVDPGSWGTKARPYIESCKGKDELSWGLNSFVSLQKHFECTTPPVVYVESDGKKVLLASGEYEKVLYEAQPFVNVYKKPGKVVLEVYLPSWYRDLDELKVYRSDKLLTVFDDKNAIRNGFVTIEIETEAGSLTLRGVKGESEFVLSSVLVLPDLELQGSKLLFLGTTGTLYKISFTDGSLQKVGEGYEFTTYGPGIYTFKSGDYEFTFTLYGVGKEGGNTVIVDDTPHVIECIVGCEGKYVSNFIEIESSSPYVVLRVDGKVTVIGNVPPYLSLLLTFLVGLGLGTVLLPSNDSRKSVNTK